MIPLVFRLGQIALLKFRPTETAAHTKFALPTLFHNADKPTPGHADRFFTRAD
jgi:hypothetical protein